MALFEQPLLILFFGTLLVAVTAVIWVQTRHRRALIGLGVATLMVLGLLGLERWVVTPAEQVKSTLRTIARRLEANDVAGVMEYISPQSEALRHEVQARMRQIKVKKISIKRNLKVTVRSGQGGASAEARFNAVATVDGPRSFGGTFTVPRFVVVRFRREGERWRVKDYESFDPRGESAN